MIKKTRIEIPPETAAKVLFESDRRCCVCRIDGRQVQIHHIDDDPSNCVPDNLAVLCFDCHLLTQIRGGFARKLDSTQIILFRTDWIKRVAAKRDAEQGAYAPELDETKDTQILRYLQVKENSDQYLYSFEADYPQVGYEGTTSNKDTNTSISSFVNRTLQRFRAESTATSEERNKIRHDTNNKMMSWNDLSISHDVSMFTPNLLSLEFSLTSYYAMAFHPNRSTATLNYRIRPAMKLELEDVFKPSTNYLEVLSKYCVRDLHSQQIRRWHDPKQRAEELKDRQDDWILGGAGPQYRNYQRFVFVRYGIRVFFDAYQVGSYAAGRFDVFVPLSELSPIMEESVAKLIL